MSDESMTKLMRPQPTEGRTEPSNRILLVLMFVVLTAFCNVVPAWAQTKVETVKVVDTAAVFARLNEKITPSFALGERQSAEPSSPSGNDTAADGASREADAATSPQTAPTKAQKYQLTPYLFMTGLKGTVGSENRNIGVDVGFSEIIDEVNFGFATTFEARLSEKWRFLSDFNYINLSDNKGTPGPLFDEAVVTAKTLFFDNELGYAIAANESSTLDAMVGLRYWHLSNEIELRRGADRVRASSSADWVDLVGGLRFKAAVSRAAFVTAKFDLGGIGSDFTYQLFGGLGLNVGKRLTSVIGYRYLSVNYRSTNTVFDASMSGLILGFGLRF